MREHFLLDPSIVFLNHGSFGSCPKVVLDDCHRLELEIERNPVEYLGRHSAEHLRNARTRLGQYVGASVDHLSFVPNATTGINSENSAILTASNVRRPYLSASHGQK